MDKNTYLYDEFISNLLDLALKKIEFYKNFYKTIANMNIFELDNDNATYLTIRFVIFYVAKINVYITCNKMTFVNLNNNKTNMYNLKHFTNSAIIYLKEFLQKHITFINDKIYDDLINNKYKSLKDLTGIDLPAFDNIYDLMNNENDNDNFSL